MRGGILRTELVTRQTGYKVGKRGIQVAGYKAGYEVESGHSGAGWEGVRSTSDRAWVGRALECVSAPANVCPCGLALVYILYISIFVV